MKSFKFRLQAVLEQRARVENLARQGFARSETALRRGEELLAELQEVKTALLDELRASRAGSFDPLEMRLYQDYLQTITQSIRDQETYVRDLQCTREAHKIHLVGASQNVQALESIHGRARLTHTQQQGRAEQSEMDEIATARFNHHKRQQE